MAFQVTDPLLLAFLNAGSVRERNEEMERVLLKARSIADRVIRRYATAEGLSRDDAEEISASVMYRLLRRLNDFEEAEPEDEPILSFNEYVAQLTYNCIQDRFRTLFPERARLRNRLRYLVSRHPRYSLWPTLNGMAVGFARWSGRTDVLETLDISYGDATPAMLNRSRPDEAIRAILLRANAPLRFDRLVRIVAELWNVTDVAPPSNAELQSDTAAEREMRDIVEALWHEVLLLPGSQRAALLLNLRVPTGLDGVSLLVATGLATVSEIAAAIDMSRTDLLRIWGQLPLSDNAIAERFSISRQQVINLRKSARERLARRILRKRTRRPR